MWAKFTTITCTLAILGCGDRASESDSETSPSDAQVPAVATDQTESKTPPTHPATPKPFKKVTDALALEFDAFSKDFGDPDEAAFAFALLKTQGMNPGPERDKIIRYLTLGGLPKNCYRGKLRILVELFSKPTSKRSLIGAVFRDTVVIDPKWAFATAGELEEPEHRKSAYFSATQQLCKDSDSFHEATEQVLRHTDGNMPDAVLAFIGDSAGFWRTPFPENPTTMLRKTLASINASPEAKEYFVSSLVKPMSAHGLEEVIAVLTEFKVTRQSAWGAASQFAPEINEENAQLFLESLPENASYESGGLLHRLQEQSGPEAVMEALSSLSSERQEWFSSRAIGGYSRAVGVPTAIENSRNSLSNPAFQSAMRALLSPFGNLAPEEKELVNTALQESQQSSPE